MSNFLNIILYGFIFMSLGVLFRQYVIARGITLPVHTFMFMAGVIIGCATKFFVPDFYLDPLHFNTLTPETIFALYTCILMFDVSFNTDVHYLKFIATHLFFIVIPTVVLVYVCVGAVGMLLFPYPNTITNYIMLMSGIIVPGPHMMKAYLGATNVHHDLRTLMESEAVFGNYIGFLAFRISREAVTYQKVLILIFLDCVVSSIIGILVGRLIIYWISRIVRDMVNQATIILALLYAGFSLSGIMGASGFMCSIVVGLVMSHHRSSMSTHFVQLFNSLVEVIIFYLASLVCISSGIYIVHYSARHMRPIDLVTTVTIFFIQNTIRGLVLLVSQYLLPKHLSKSSSVIVWACNIRGSYSITMGFITFHPIRETTSRAFGLIMMQIFLSFIANSMICTYVVGYLSEETLRKKKRMVERAARLMITIRNSSVDSLRNSVSIADADWNVVLKQTQLKTEFMQAYRYASWLSKDMQNSKRDSKEIDPQDLKKEAIRQINMSEKTMFSRLYGVGILSRSAMLTFAYLVNHCQKLTRMMIPKDIFVTNNESLLIRLQLELSGMVERKSLHLLVRLVVIIICFQDCWVILFSFMYVIFDRTSEKYNMLMFHNCIMLGGYIVWFFFMCFRNRSFRSKTLYQSICKYIILATLFDVMITLIPTILKELDRANKFSSSSNVEIGEFHYARLYLVTNVIFTITRLSRSLSAVHVIPALQRSLLELVTKMRDRELFTEYDMAKGFIRVRGETEKKLSNMITDLSMATELQLMCHRNILESQQNLGLSEMLHPQVMAALKTRVALRLILNTLEEELHEITETGMLGEADAEIIEKELLAKIMVAQKFPYVLPPISTRAVLQNIPWVDGNLELLFEIEALGQLVKFYPNDIICTQGCMPGGIFIVLLGLIRAESLRVADQSSRQLKAHYFLEAVKATSKIDNASLTGQLQLHGFFSRGSIIGELCFLNEKPTHKSYRCATYVEVIFINTKDLSDIVKRSPDLADPLSKTELKMWKTVAIRQGLKIIHSNAHNTNLSKVEIFKRLKESWVVDGSVHKVFTVTPNEVAALILIQGYVNHFYSELRYIGPCILPINQQKFVSHSEIGPRVIYLVIKSKTMEDNDFDSLIPENPIVANYEDDMTISSGASDIPPYRRDKTDLIPLDDETDLINRMTQMGISEDYQNLVLEYKDKEKVRKMKESKPPPPGASSVDKQLKMSLSWKD